MKTVIPIEFESYLVEKINSGLAPDMNEVVFAYIPDLDINEDIDRAKGLPPESTWVHKQSIDKASKLNRNTLIYSVVVPSKYTFTFNAVYLHDKHTQNSCGLVIHKLDELKEIGTTMTRSFAQQYLGAAEIADIHVTPETWQIDFSARIEGIDDDVRLNNLDHYGHTAFISGFNVEKISANEYRIREGIAYVGGLRCELKNTVTKTITAKPDGIYLDVVREGTILSWWINTPVVRTSKTPLSDYIDNSGNQHYVTRIAGIRSDGSIEDWREWNIVSQAEAEEGESSTPRKWTALRVLQAIKAWAQKNLGTAASRDVTENRTDFTLGRISRVGDFGNGISLPLPPNVDFHNLGVGDYSGSVSGVKNGPSGTIFYGTVSVRRRDDVSERVVIEAELINGIGSSNKFITFQTVEGWTPWYEFYHTGNTGTAVTHDVTSSSTDTTAGRLLKVGDFGINSTIAHVFVSTTGDDSTGDGTSGNPFLTVGRAIDWINTRKDDSFLIRLVGSSAQTPIDLGAATKRLSNKIVRITHTDFNQTYHLNWNSGLMLENVLLDLYGNNTERQTGCNIYINTPNMFVAPKGKNTVMFGGFYTSNIRFQSDNQRLVFQDYRGELGQIELVVGYRGNLLVDNSAKGCRINFWNINYVPVIYTVMNASEATIAPEIDSTSGVIFTAGIYHSGNLPPATESDAASTSTEVKAWSPQRIRQAIDARIPNTSEAVNSYCLCIHNQEAGISPTTGSLISASKLYRCNAAGTAVATTSGTWRLMTPISISSNNPAERVGLFVRVN